MKALFVCHGNIERSASAEIISKQLYPHWNTRSCGVAATPGRITGKKMRTALAEKGFLPTANKEHGIRSSQITQDDIDWADRVFYMDGGNERRLFAQFGKVSHAQRLSDYVEGANTVPNPGRCNDLSQHLRIVDMIVEAFPKIEQEIVDNT